MPKAEKKWTRGRPRVERETAQKVSPKLHPVRVLTYDEKQRMGSREIQDRTYGLAEQAVSRLPEDERDAVLSLSEAMKASFFGGPALEERMREIKAFLRTALGTDRPSDKRILEEMAPETLHKYEKAMPAFRENARNVQGVLRKNFGNEVTVYFRAFNDRDDEQFDLESMKTKGYIWMALPLQSTSYAPSISHKFGNTLYEVRVPTKAVLADSRVSPLYTDPVENEVFVDWRQSLRAKLIPSDVDRALRPDMFPKALYPKTIDALPVITLKEKRK